MIRKLVPLYATFWRAALVLLAIEISFVSVLRYVTGGDTPPPPVAANAWANPFLILHVLAAMTALLIGGLQFVRRIRTRWPAFHRAIGYTCIAACAVGAPAGFMLALGAIEGPLARSGFAVAALLWGLFTWLGWRAVAERRIADHREWMLRAWAMVTTAITLRLMLPASAMLGLKFYTAYPVIAWLAWLTNLALMEVHIRRTRHPTARPARLAPMRAAAARS